MAQCLIAATYVTWTGTGLIFLLSYFHFEANVEDSFATKVLHVLVGTCQILSVNASLSIVFYYSLFVYIPLHFLSQSS